MDVWRTTNGGEQHTQHVAGNTRKRKQTTRGSIILDAARTRALSACLPPPLVREPNRTENKMKTRASGEDRHGDQRPGLVVVAD